MAVTRTNIISYLCALIVIFGYTSAITFGAQSHDFKRAPSADGTASTEIITNWFSSKKSKTYMPHASPQASSEIWGRVRKHFNLNPARKYPTLQKHIKRYSKQQDYINKLVRNASPYLFFVLEEVEKRGMPSEIALLPMIESDFDPLCTSHKGAVGIWQIMPTLGKMHGLKQNSLYDGRKDIYESTKVALDHLVYLQRRFNGNWLLALAAYNSGEAKVKRAIKKNKLANKGTDFWSLSLPKETTNFVPSLLALATIIKSPKEFGVHLPNIPNQPVFERVNAGKPIDIARAAKLADISEAQLRKLNPGLRQKTMNPSGPFHLLVPVRHAQLFQEKVHTLPTSKATTSAASKAKPKATSKSKTKKTSTKTKTKSKSKTQSKAKPAATKASSDIVTINK